MGPLGVIPRLSAAVLVGYSLFQIPVAAMGRRWPLCATSGPRCALLHMSPLATDHWLAVCFVQVPRFWLVLCPLQQCMLTFPSL
jgi:hypothetical protein